jgi:hypothetical protein
MSFFPNFSNIDDNIRKTLDGRRGNPLTVSNLNVWVKLTSAVGGGLILYSNPDYKLFKAAGDGNIATIYGSRNQSGVLGVDWKGKPVYATDGLGFYPSPVVTSIEIDEGAGNISRKATVSMTAFTKGQAELLSEYFLEPGYTVFFEFGWNTPASAGQVVKTNADSISEMQNIKNLIERRGKSNGTYENYLGFITGGNISVNGTSWDITIKITGFTDIPLHLKTHEGLTETEIEDSAKAIVYNSIKDTDDGKRMFKIMFNDLPEIRQIQSVKDLKDELSNEANFINFDEKVKTDINNLSDGNLYFFRSGVKSEGETIEFPTGTKIIDDDRFIRFGAMMRILQASIVDGFELGNQLINVNINSSNPQTIISAFPQIFSLDKTKLFIPNANSPKFSLKDIASKSAKGSVPTNGLVDNSVKPSGGGRAGLLTRIVRFVFGKKEPPSNANIKVTNIEFPQQTSADTIGGKAAGYWGYLDDLYVNFDFFKNTISTPNFDIRNVLYTILNGLSSAAGNIWDFQIVEQSCGSVGTDAETGTINLTIIDLNFTPKTSKDDIYEFHLMGEQSIFQSNTFEMDISGQMMNHIIGKRIGLEQSDPKDISPEKQKGLFTDKTDQILPKIQKRNVEDKLPESPTAETLSAETPTAEKDDQEIIDQNLQLFLDTIGIYPRVNNENKVKGKSLDSLTYFATSTDKVFFDKLRNRNLSSKKDSTDEYSPLLPVTFSFKIHGISGIKRGDKFKVKGLPKQFQNGFFQVTSVKHSVSDMKWETDVDGGFRNQLFKVGGNGNTGTI